MAGADEKESWGKYMFYVLKQLEQHNECVTVLDDKIDKLREESQVARLGLSNDIANLKGRAAVWGAVAALIATVIVQIIIAIIKMKAG